MRQGRKRREESDTDRKYALAGSRPSGGRGGQSGIPAGSRGSGGGRSGGGSGIPAGSRGGGGARGGSGIPAGSSVRGKKRRGGGGVPAGSKSAQATPLESKADQSSMLADVDEQKGIVEAYVSVTGVEDNVGDIIEPGAYAKTLQTRTPKGVWSHRWEEPVSKTLAIKEIMPGDPTLPDTLPDGSAWPSSAGALYVKTQFNLDSDIGRRAFSNVKFFSDGTGQDTAAWSIGYKATRSMKDKKGVRHIKELDLYEYSPVLHGANSHAKTLSVKSLDQAIEALHFGGYDTSELDVKSDDTNWRDSDGLSLAEVKAIPLAIDILNAYAAEVGLKAAPVGDPDLVEPDERWVDSSSERLPSLSERLEELLEAEDFPDLLSVADAFDQAVLAQDDDAIAGTAHAFIDVLDAEDAGDPDDPDTWNDVRDVVGGALDDVRWLLYGIEPDDDEGEDGSDGDAEPDDLADDADAYWSDESDAAADEAPSDEAGRDGQDGAEGGEGEQGMPDAGKSARRSERKEISQAERDKAADKNHALSDGSYPIRSERELRSAIRLRTQGNAPNEVVNTHIRKRAKTLGLEHMLPDDLKGDGKSAKADPPFTLPDMGWADDAFNAIDFGGSRV